MDDTKNDTQSSLLYCDICAQEYPFLLYQYNKREKEINEMSAFKKFFCHYSHLPTPRSPKYKSPIIMVGQVNEAFSATLLLYLDHHNIFGIPPNKYDLLLSKPVVSVCDHHIYDLEHNIASKGKYCSNCGEEYLKTELEDMHLRYHSLVSSPYIKCRNCNVECDLIPLISKGDIKQRLLFCADCKRKTENAKTLPSFEKNICPSCSSTNVQIIKYAEYYWLKDLRYSP